MPVKPDRNKKMIRSEIDEQIADYLSGGGEVASIDKGISGRDNPYQALPPQSFDQPKAERTLVNDAISSIEARKKPVVQPKPNRNRQPQKEIVYDDFGEPLRWTWKDN